jgi:hypothetical protein
MDTKIIFGHNIRARARGSAITVVYSIVQKDENKLKLGFSGPELSMKPHLHFLSL